MAPQQQDHDLRLEYWGASNPCDTLDARSAANEPSRDSRMRLPSSTRKSGSSSGPSGRPSAMPTGPLASPYPAAARAAGWRSRASYGSMPSGGYGLDRCMPRRRGRPTSSQAVAPKIQKAPAMTSQVPLLKVVNSESGVIVMSSMHGSTNPTLNRMIRAQASHMHAA